MLTITQMSDILNVPRDVAERRDMLRGYGKKLIDLRESKKESQNQAANAVNISVSAIGMYEREERVPRDEIKIRLSEHYGVPVADIFYS